MDTCGGGEYGSAAGMPHRDPHPFDDGSLWLTDAGAETALIFHQGVDLPGFATFPLLDSDNGRAALQEYIEPFLELARRHDAGFVLGTATWRANPDWGVELGYDEAALAAVNRKAVEFAEELRAGAPRSERPVLIEGVIGPRGDAYAPSSLMTAGEAERYHSAQLQALGDSAADVACALTITYADEAVGIVRAAQAAGLPVSVSFTVETDGRLPSGQTLRAAIEQVDAETDGAPLHYMINCAHPTHFSGALGDDGPWLERLRGLRANASMLSHAELDESEDLDDGDPAELAQRYVELRGTLPNLTLLGGCCGTDIRHITSICDAWLA
jgi:S-methylmethionine-dependent homocysteine/selenocysteine methylase